MKTVIFDFDGTLADSFDEVLAFLQSQTRKPISAAERDGLRGLPMKDLALAVGVPHWKLPLVFFRGRATLKRRMHAVPLFEGMREVLNGVRTDKAQLYIMSSNSRRNIRRFLHEQQLAGYFKHIYPNAGWFGKGKSLRRLLRDRRLTPDSVIYIGDETRDIAGAHAAGMAAMAVTWGFGNRDKLAAHHPLITVDTRESLLEAIHTWLQSN